MCIRDSRDAAGRPATLRANAPPVGSFGNVRDVDAFGDGYGTAVAYRARVGPAFGQIAQQKDREIVADAPTPLAQTLHDTIGHLLRHAVDLAEPLRHGLGAELSTELSLIHI